MKKLLLYSLLGLSMGANAQTVVFEDSFESYTDFAITNVGSWTLRDDDGQLTYGIAGVTFLNSGEAKSFQVFNSTTTAPTTTNSFSARTGNKMMTSFASTTYPWNNDWLISPSIALPSTGSNELSFWAKSSHTGYGSEKFQVFISTTGTATEDFTAISPVVTTLNDVKWYEYKYDLSAYDGHVYIAIKCTSQDQFALNIDDFKVTNSAAQTEAPGCPTLTLPANGSTTVSINPSVILAWAASATGGVASSYDVYFGTTANPTTLLRNVTTTSTTLTGLTPLTTYYWRVVSKNAIGEATGCTEYSFTTANSNPPACVGNMSPANGATGVAEITTPLSWSVPTTGGAPTTYDVYWGESLEEMVKLGSTANTAVNITGTLAGVTYYWRVVPVNADGEATGCETYSLTTNNPVAPYCGPFVYTSVEPITSVNFKFNTAQTSPVTSNLPHETFLTKEFKVEKGGTSTISINSNTAGNYTHYYSVFVDWNQDGDFSDAGESYFTTTGKFFGNQASNGQGTAGIKVRDLVVPADAEIGKTRMRVKAIYSSNTNPSASGIVNIADPCANTNSSFGQAEDYTIEVVPQGVLAVADINKSNVSIYPNPFTDVLRISEVKNVKSIVISDASGRQIKTMAPASEINLSELRTGLYIVSLIMEDGTVATTKAIKK